MKLNTLALAIVVAAVPFAAQAEVKIGGDFGVGYFGDSSGTKEIKEAGSEINVDVSQKAGGVTYYGHVEMDMGGTGNTASFQEIRVGAKGAFGEIILGENDNGCDSTDVGGYPDVFMAAAQGGCKGSDVNNIVYKRKAGPATFAISHNPNVSSEKHSAIGVKSKFGPIEASLGYEAGSDLGNDDKNVAVGLSATFGAVKLGLRANKAKAYDKANIGVNAAYTVGANKFYGGFGETDDGATEKWAVGYNRALGGKTEFVFEAAETDGDADTSFGVGLRHKF